MRRAFFPLAALAFVAAGCSGGDGDSGDVAAANKAAAAVPKSVDELPANLPADQRAIAEAGMASQQAMAAQMNGQGAAMKAAQERAR